MFRVAFVLALAAGASAQWAFPRTAAGSTLLAQCGRDSGSNADSEDVMINQCYDVANSQCFIGTTVNDAATPLAQVHDQANSLVCADTQKRCGPMCYSDTLHECISCATSPCTKSDSINSFVDSYPCLKTGQHRCGQDCYGANQTCFDGTTANDYSASSADYKNSEGDVVCPVGHKRCGKVATASSNPRTQCFNPATQECWKDLTPGTENNLDGDLICLNTQQRCGNQCILKSGSTNDCWSYATNAIVTTSILNGKVCPNNRNPCTTNPAVPCYDPTNTDHKCYITDSVSKASVADQLRADLLCTSGFRCAHTCALTGQNCWIRSTGDDLVTATEATMDGLNVCSSTERPCGTFANKNKYPGQDACYTPATEACYRQETVDSSSSRADGEIVCTSVTPGKNARCGSQCINLADDDCYADDDLTSIVAYPTPNGLNQRDATWACVKSIVTTASNTLSECTCSRADFSAASSVVPSLALLFAVVAAVFGSRF
jgi:hypothetical protein